jgi:outer membrane receptor protein involved in Fe transport
MELWTVRLSLDNALDESYYAGSLNRNAVMPGIPRNFRSVITYTF